MVPKRIINFVLLRKWSKFPVDLIGMPKIQKIKTAVRKIILFLLIGAGGFLILAVILAMTSLPFWARYRLGNHKAFVPQNPQTIVVMGAGGFPSEALLMRLWYTAELAAQFPVARVVITTPGDTLDSQSTIMLMRATLLKWGVDSTRFILESEGLNTRHQAMLVHSIFEQGQIQEPLVIVSSPEHIYRSVRSFVNVGFTRVSGQPASDAMLETDLRIESKKLGSNAGVPDVGNSISMRYRFWDYLKTEITVAREYLAIAYYWLSGWI
jgi:uncharacterized SAM-binding protein YcdF (DUF218 family)